MKNCSIGKWRTPYFGSSQFLGVRKSIWIWVWTASGTFNMLCDCYSLCLEMYPPSLKTIFLSIAEVDGCSNCLWIFDRNWFNTLSTSLQSKDTKVLGEAAIWDVSLLICFFLASSSPGSCAYHVKCHLLHLLIGESPVPNSRLTSPFQGIGS